MPKQETKQKRRLTHDAYTIGWVCVLVSELNASRAMLDEEDEQLEPCDNDDNSYLLGRIGNHNVVITFPGSGVYGTNSATGIAKNLIRTFRNIRFGLMVGIGGGAPKKPHPHDTLMDIRLGDVVVSSPKGNHGGVLHYDMGKRKNNGKFDIDSYLNKPPKILLKAIELLQSDQDFGQGEMNEYIADVAKKSSRLPALRKYKFPGRETDELFQSDYEHASGDDCDDCDKSRLEKRVERDFDEPVIHYGLIASGNSVVRSAQLRNELRDALGVACFEMEAAGLMDDFPCIVIRGICDYSDDHKNKKWQPYAAVVAAAYAKDLLRVIQTKEIESTDTVAAIFKGLQQDVATIAGAVERDQQLKILDWIAPSTYAEQHLDIVEQQQEGTGRWFLESPEFVSWIKAETNTLFCPGIPGAGKSVLSSIVIEHLSKLPSTESKTNVMYLYCNYKRQEDQTLDKLVSMLLRQIVEQLETIPEVVHTMYAAYKGKVARPSPKEIYRTLLAILGGLGRIFIVVDALDECTSGVRRELLTKIQEFQQKSKTCFMATSRPISDVTEYFAKAPQIKIKANREDVEKYVESHLALLPTCVRNSSELQEKIRAQIANTVDGMFLLAKLNLNSLTEKITELEVEDALGDMEKHPADLNVAYNEALSRIDSQPEGHRGWAYRTLSWLLYARRPLKSIELQHALAIRTGDKSTASKNLPNVAEVISLCAGLVTFNQESKIVQLVHYTIQQYLTKSLKTPPEWISLAEGYITTTCLTYLSFNEFEDGFCGSDAEFEERLKSNVLYEYAACQWGHHARSATTTENQLILEFLNSKAHVLAASQVLMTSVSSAGYSQKIAQEIDALHLAAYFGLANIIKTLIDNGKDPNITDTYLYTPLSYAAANGHASVVELLLSYKTVNPDPMTSSYQAGRMYLNRSPLSLAAANGHCEVVRILLENEGIDADSKATDLTDEGRTPLSFAAGNGYADIVKLLIAKEGTNPDSRASGHYMGRSPLSFAAEEGHESVVMLLVREDGVDPDSKSTKYGDDYHRTPLSYAAANGHTNVVDFLLRQDGVDPNSKSSQGRTPLSLAAEAGHEAVAKLLLGRSNVDIDCKATGHNGKGRTALSYAAGAGHAAIVDLLLSKGADPDSLSDHEQTPLSYAALGGHESVVRRLLLESRVDPDSRAIGFVYNQRTPLSLAAEGGHETVVKLLIDQPKVNPDSINDNKRTPLSFAASNGHAGIVKQFLLLDYVDPDSRDNNKRTPLSYAAFNGHTAVIKLLLANDEVDPDSRATGYYQGRSSLSFAAEEGRVSAVKLLLARDEVEADSMSYKKQTPLSFAAAGGHEIIVKLLLERASVNPDSMSHNKRSPLSFAAENGHCEVVRLLLATNKVNPDSRASNGRSPLSFASERGHESVVKLLLASNKVNISAKDSNGQAPISYATAYRHRSISKLLQSYDPTPRSQTI
ncbi:hypothetical protein TWF694_005385 [Orbilia ellipsospora]|uniref:Ankyrin repeat protein n=1 Tax=Orbilia ellipsospora TaxID=2528407 RepID=A0AAV9WSX3_9PEZI